MIGLHFDPPYFSEGQMGRWQSPQAADGGVSILRDYPSVSAARRAVFPERLACQPVEGRCHLPIWLRKMERRQPVEGRCHLPIWLRKMERIGL